MPSSTAAQFSVFTGAFIGTPGSCSPTVLNLKYCKASRSAEARQEPLAWLNRFTPFVTSWCEASSFVPFTPLQRPRLSSFSLRLLTRCLRRVEPPPRLRHEAQGTHALCHATAEGLRFYRPKTCLCVLVVTPISINNFLKAFRCQDGRHPSPCAPPCGSAERPKARSCRWGRNQTNRKTGEA